MKPFISIVMLVKNELHHLRQSIPIVQEQGIPYGYEIIVIDSDSTDGSVAFIRETMAMDPRFSLYQIPPEEFHHARTRNLGMALAKGNLVVFLSGDAIPCDGHWLHSLVTPVVDGEAHGIAAAYGKQVPRPDADIGNFCRMTFNYSNNCQLKDRNSNLSRKELFFFSSVNCCINKKLVSPPFFNNSITVNEDITISYKIINSNLKIAYCPAAGVIHSHNYSYMAILRRYFDNAVTYKKTGIFFNDSNPVNKDTLTFLRHSIMILKDKEMKDWVRFFLFCACAGIGLKLGLNYHYLPKALCNRLSKHRTV